MTGNTVGKFAEKYNERGAKNEFTIVPGHGTIEGFFSPEDLESARHFGPAIRTMVSNSCIEQQGICLEKYGMGDPRYRSSFEGKGCPELLTASCSIKPTGLLNTPGNTCEQSFDCSIKFDITPQCSAPAGEYWRLPGCKGFVDREIFEQGCYDFARTYPQCWSRRDGRRNDPCCKYAKKDPEMMKYFD